MVPVLTGLNLDEEETLTLGELSRACAMRVEWVIDLVQEGVLEPSGRGVTNWRFAGSSMRRASVAARLQRDLGINLAGIALALDLLDEIHALRKRLR